MSQAQGDARGEAPGEAQGEPKPRLLVVDDDRPMCEVLEKGLRYEGFEVQTLQDPLQAVERLREQAFDVLVTDLNMRGMSGLELTERALALQPELPVVVITAFGSLEAAVEAIRAGAYDFITKPFEIEVAALALRRAAQHRKLRGDLRRLRQAAEDRGRFGELIGESEPMRRLFDLLERLADSDLTVLITGESGTGKELVARALHQRGRRASGPFVAVNCAALPATLLESELFGHERGAFTDARSARRGLFLQANGGTLFLDEIGEMPAPMQAKLLRALQDRRLRPVGGEKEISFDARVLAATNQDLDVAVAEGRFRDDLYFRLNVLEVEVPPLRERGNDILLLAQGLLERAAERAGKEIRGFSPEVAASLLAYRWPGNVRELTNCMERSVALARGALVALEDLPPRVRARPAASPLAAGEAAVSPNAPAEALEQEALLPLEEVEKRHILRVLEAVGGQRGAAAKILGLDRKTLYRKLERWGHDPER